MKIKATQGNPRPRRPPVTQQQRTQTAAPLYAHVARRLKDQIVDGAYPIGKHLPTESALCELFDVSRHTIRDALRILRDEGLVSSRQGAGTVVMPPPSADSFGLQATSINELVAYAANMHTEIRSTATQMIAGRLAVRLGVASGHEWLVVRGIARARGKQLPVCWSDYYIHRDYAALGRLLPRLSGPIFLMIEDVFAVNISEIDQEISSGAIPAALAASLKAKPGAPAIEVQRTYKTRDGKVVQVSVHTHPASRFRHSMKLQRVRSY